MFETAMIILLSIVLVFAALNAIFGVCQFLKARKKAGR